MGLPRGYKWKVVVDPTRSGDYPGIFYGGHFRWTDIHLPCHDREAIPCPFPTGTVFENIETGERVLIRQGKILFLGNEPENRPRPTRPAFGGLQRA